MKSPKIDEESEKTCFVIAPIGEVGSSIREYSDTVLNHIIKPIVEKYGYRLLRADQLSAPGIITTQVIEQLIKADLVIADLSMKNPNVFYELAIRHVTKKPFIQMINKDEKIPFDVGSNRTILFTTDVKFADAAKLELEGQIKAIEQGIQEVDNPINIASNIINLKLSGNYEQISIAQIMEVLSEIKTDISLIKGTHRNVISDSSGNYPGFILEGHRDYRDWDPEEKGTIVVEKLQLQLNEIDDMLLKKQTQMNELRKKGFTQNRTASALNSDIRDLQKKRQEIQEKMKKAYYTKILI